MIHDCALDRQVSFLGLDACMTSQLKVQVTLLNPDDMDPKHLSGIGKIRIMRIGIICIGRDWGPSNMSALDENPDYTCPD